MTTSPKTKKAAAFDASAFEAALDEAAAAQRAGQSYGAVGALLRETLPSLRAEAMRQGPRGDRMARSLARSVEDVVKALYARAPAAKAPIAICAVGGFGRRELAPFSDVDLLFLHRGEIDADQRAAADFVLYALWDSGLKVGHGVHTPKSAAKFAGEDLIARTAYLDARFLCGARSLFDELESAFDKLRRRTKKQFVNAKLKEQDERQTRADETRYLIEPDIKEGKGGLRDIQTIRWIYKYVYGAAIGSSRAIDKILAASERRALAKAERFLWSLRFHLHDLRGRADEKLSFDIQPRIAERLEYADRSGMTATERLMKHYFLNAVEIGRLTRILCAKLEEEQAKRLPALPKALPKALQSDEAPGKPNLRLRNGRLDFASAAKARRTPRDFFRLFRAYAKKPAIDFHPDALAIVAENAALVTSDVRKDPTVAKLFTGLLTRAGDPARVLRAMTETGLLGKYIPAFGSIVGRIHYGLYRRFTLDEHVLRCIGVLAKVKRGELKDEHPISTAIMAKTKNPLVYYAAVLLHETIWAVKGKSAAQCERLAAGVARRLGLGEEDAASVAWAASHHLIMVRTAERRDLTQTQAIATFAQLVETRARLDVMLVMSVCYLRIVGQYSWDAVVRRQLTELYEASAVWLEKGDEALRRRFADRAAQVRAETRKRLSGWKDAEKEQFLSRLTDPMLTVMDADIVMRFADLARAAEEDRADAAVTVNARDGELEAIVYADDRAGLLADIAGAAARAGLSVRALQALTTEDGKALDILSLRAADGAPIDDPEQARRVHALLLAAARAASEEPPSHKRRLGDRRSLFDVQPKVLVDLNASQEAAVIEAEGLDRPGLLYALSRALSKLEAMIASAHIATYGERAVDTFYIHDSQGRKITDARVLKRIEQRLLAVLSAGSNA